MRHRHPINIWPAFADVMTVLAVVGLFTTLALSSLVSSERSLGRRLLDLERTRRSLEEHVKQLEQERQVLESRWNQEREGLRQQVREAARNEKMFQAIQEAQRFIDQISQTSGLSFGADQSLQFGDDLVSFRLNSVEPIWSSGGRERLHRFCDAVSRQLSIPSGSMPVGSLFMVQVEGHTDSIRCPGDPNCNWWISSGRAANFVAVMKKPEFCPGGAEFTLRPIGFADTKPIASYMPPTRRIAVRLVPDYEKIITRLEVSD